MSNLARKLDRARLHQEIATVVEVGQDDRVGVQLDGRRHAARRAASCLLRPEPGDVVLLALGSGWEAWVLAVLERKGARARLELDGDVEISAPRGRLSLAGQEGLALTSAGELSLAARAVRLRALEGSLVVGTLVYVGRLIEAQVEKVSTVADAAELLAERLVQRVGRLYRRVTEMEQVRARQIDYTAEATLTLRGENAVVSARKLAKVDAEQIHLG
ncbi:MAG: DUF3540 domain-containing protein [Deltaproteobacteria bacterium]|nr:DUF3540 domain-containing protein [Deltaproteobacteria bacterium]